MRFGRGLFFLVVVCAVGHADDPPPGNRELPDDVKAALVKLAERLNRDLERAVAADRWGEALKAAEARLAIARQFYPSWKYPGGHPQIAESLSVVGTLHDRAGAPEKALSSHEEALAEYEKLYGGLASGHRDLAAALDRVARALHGLGRTKEAVPYGERSLKMREKLLRDPSDHVALAEACHAMAILLGDLGRTKDALPHAERAIHFLPPEGWGNPWEVSAASASAP